MKGLSYNKNKPTWKKRRVFSAFGHFFLLLHDKLFWRKKPKEKVQSIFHLPLEANI
jgi:hypothetical protein